MMISQIILTITVVCSLNQELTPSSLTEYLSCKVDQRQVHAVNEWSSLIEQHFKPEDHIRALKIIYCESKGKTYAKGKNKDGSYDVGIWQFNDHTWAWLKPKLKITSTRYDPEVSTAVASWLVYNDGWYHWNSSKHCWGDNNDRQK